MWVKRNGFSLKTVTALLGVGGGKDIDRGRCHSRQAGGQAGKKPSQCEGSRGKTASEPLEGTHLHPPTRGKTGGKSMPIAQRSAQRQSLDF